MEQHQKEWRDSVILPNMLWDEGGTELAMTHKNLLIEIQRTGIYVMQQRYHCESKGQVKLSLCQKLQYATVVGKHGISFGC